MSEKRYIGAAEVLQGLGLSDQYHAIAGAFYVAFDTDLMTKDRTWRFWVREAFVGHPQLGDVLIVSSEDKGMNYAVPFQDTDDGVTFSELSTWTTVVKAWIIPPGVDAAETAEPPAQDPNEHLMREARSGRALRLLESDESASGPLIMEAVIIEPGWGNERHNNYYPADMLKKCAGVFSGVKMYATDHKEDERSVLTEVSQILECPVSFTETGAIVAKIAIFDEAFATNVRNRDAAGEQEGVDLLKDLHLSILAEGLALEEPYTEGDRTGNYVTDISEAYAVDWVTRAGAGGHATRLMETDEEPVVPTEPEAKENDDEEDPAKELAESGKEIPVNISEQTKAPDTPPEGTTGDTPPDAALEKTIIDGILSESKLPETARRLLSERAWPSEDELRAKIALVQEQWKKEVGSGKVYGMGTSEPQKPPEPPKPIEERERSILNRYLGSRERVPRVGGKNDG